MPNNYPRIAIVTGATSGIGEATARKLVSAGFGVVGSGRTVAKLAALEQELGAAFCAVAGDAADPAVIGQLFAAACAHFGKPADIVIANAGRGLGGSVKDADLSEFAEVVNINITGTLALLQQAAQAMLAGQQQGYPKTAADIVIIGSVVGRHISPFSAVYGSTKFAVHALAEGLRREVGPKGIRVSLVEPGIVLSGFQAAAQYSDEMVQGFEDRWGPLLVGDDVANAIHYIVSQPPHIHISDIVIRPTRQDYP
ncbi:MAG: SDR family oxidoreductase [Methylovulum sp.]|nr:SDR family oxidoreductase [Methylovulum sp.]